MNRKCHLIFGTAVSAAVVLNLNTVASGFPHITNTFLTGAFLLAGGIVGSLFPDIDHLISKKQHRGIMHHIAIYIAGLVLSYQYFTPLIGLCLGAITHLFLDMFNSSGIPLFGKKRLCIELLDDSDDDALTFTEECTVLLAQIGIIVALRSLNIAMGLL